MNARRSVLTKKIGLTQHPPMRVVGQCRPQIDQFICTSTPAAFVIDWALLVAALAALGALHREIVEQTKDDTPFIMPPEDQNKL
jgi:hypothetical protein